MSFWVCEYVLLLLWLTLHRVWWIMWENASRFFLLTRLHSIPIYLCTHDDYISGLDWVETWHWFYWYRTGYAGLVSQSNAHTHITRREQSNWSDRLYITSHEYTHKLIRTHKPFAYTIFIAHFFPYPFSFIFANERFYFPSLISICLLLCAVSTICHHDGMTRLTLFAITFFVVVVVVLSSIRFSLSFPSIFIVLFFVSNKLFRTTTKIVEYYISQSIQQHKLLMYEDAFWWSFNFNFNSLAFYICEFAEFHCNLLDELECALCIFFLLPFFSHAICGSIHIFGWMLLVKNVCTISMITFQMSFEEIKIVYFLMLETMFKVD